MNRWRRVSRIALVAALAWAGPLSAEARPLPSDPRLVTGKLDNGVAYVFFRNDKPPRQLALMMHIRTGSLNETDSQRGVAHFLEHMVFNGTENFKPGELIPYFESIGMRFGGDVNANTSFDRTSYNIFLPDATPEQIDKGLMVLSDYAFRATLTEKEIDEERGVILEEARGRKSASQRIRDKLWPQLYPGARFIERLPIGIESVILEAPRREFEDYYRAWYRPELTTVLAVGDVELDAVLPPLKKWFGQYKAPIPAREPMRAGIRPFAREKAVVVADPEITTAKVELLLLRPAREPATTVDQWRAELVESIASHLFGRRCTERIRKGEATYRSAGASASDFFNEAIAVSAAASGEAADWQRMLEELIADLSRARQYGFNGQELDLVKKQIMAARERAVRTEATRDSRAIVQALFAAVDNRVPVLSAQQELDLVRELLPTITAEEVSDAFRRLFEPAPTACVLQMPEKEGVALPAEDEILAAARAAWARKVEPLATRAVAEELLPALPPSGRIVEEAMDGDLAIRSLWLSNGVRVHYRFMDYKKDSIAVSITLAGGGIEETPANIGVTSVASLAVSNPATRRLDSTAIRDLRAGRNVSVGGGMTSDDAFTLRVGGSPRDLEFGLQLAYALLTDGRIEEAAFKNWRISALRSIEQSETNVSFRCGEVLSELLSSGDPRRLSVKKEHIEALSLEQGQAWFERLCREAPIEVAVVGDMPWDDVRPLIERYVGSLPARRRTAAHLDPLRQIRRKPGPHVRRVEVRTVTPGAVAFAGFVGTQGDDVEARRALGLAGSILSSRLLKRVREELSLVYSISASSTPGWVYTEAGRFQAGAKCKPENVDRVVAEIEAAFADFAEKGPTAEELENARKQILTQLDKSMKEPQYWLDLLETFDLRRRNLEDAKTIVKAFESITGEQVRAAFSRFRTPERSYAITGIPVAPTSAPAVESSGASGTP